MIRHTTTGHWKFGVFLSLITAALWGITPIAIKVVLEEMDPYTIAWYRFLFSSLFVGIWILKKNKIRDLSVFRGSVVWLTILAIVGLSLNYAFFMIGLNYIPPSTAAVVIQLAPMFFLFGSLLFFKESFSIYQCIGFAVLVIGLTCFFNMRLTYLVSGFSGYAFGVLLIICAAIFWVFYALAQKQLLLSLPSEVILLFIYAGCCLMFTTVSHPFQIFHLNYIQLLLLLFTCLNTFLAYGSFSEALNHLEASRVSTVLSIIPLITIASMACISYFLPGRIETEPLNLISLIGAVLVVVGSMISTLIRFNRT